MSTAKYPGFAAVFGQILKEADVPQRQVALLAGVTQPAVAQWVTGKTRPRLRNIWLLG